MGGIVTVVVIVASRAFVFLVGCANTKYVIHIGEMRIIIAHISTLWKRGR